MGRSHPRVGLGDQVSDLAYLAYVDDVRLCKKEPDCIYAPGHVGTCVARAAPLYCAVCGAENLCLTCGGGGILHGKECPACHGKPASVAHGVVGCLVNLRRQLERLREDMGNLRIVSGGEQ